MARAAYGRRFLCLTLGSVAPAVAELPQVLSAGDARLYREIFTLQEAGKWGQADKKIAKLSDKLLMGFVLEQRYMHPRSYRSKYKELKGWLDRYADHPGAERIHKLALKRRPSGARKPQAPLGGPSRLAASAGPDRYSYQSKKSRSKSQKARVRALKRQIRRNVLRERLTVTQQLLASAEVRRLFDKVELDQALTKVAAAWFYQGKADKAFKMAEAAAARSGAYVVDAHWVAGLAAWRLGKLSDAARHFEAVATSTRASGEFMAGGAYWAARSHLKLQQPDRMSHWLRQAALYPASFYGLLARRALGLRIQFDFKRHDLSPEQAALLKKDRHGRRALALLQVGRHDSARQELWRFSPKDRQTARGALLALADQAQMPDLAYRLGDRAGAAAPQALPGGRLDAALYPIPPWQPAEGFKVDRALIYALIRKESAFKPRALSKDGARGLMQLMPRTARFVAAGRNYGRALFDPAVNLELGQRYIMHLLSLGHVRGDLFRLATAYNGGPGNLGKWQRRVQADDDPLLFIESLPSRETRLFIERVLTNLWIYRQRLNQPAPSLAGTAAGEWPKYQPLDSQRRELAQHDTN